MASALFSGCDVLSNWSTAGADIASTIYGGTNQNGSVGPAASTAMSFVGKYVNSISGAELAEIIGAGVSVFFYFENGAINGNPSAYTYTQGVADANDVLGSLSSLGLPSTQPVYYAIDFNASTAAVTTYIGNYFQGIIDTVGNEIDTSAVGLYGSVGCYTDLGLQLNSQGYKAPTYFVQSRSTGFRNNANLGGSTNVWQWPPAYNPSGNQVVGGHGVDGCFAYTTDFGQYPRGNPPPPPPQTGTLNTASVIGLIPTFTEPKKQSLTSPEDKHDQVIFSTTFTNTTTYGTNPYTISGSDVPITNINQTAYPVGNFTFDGGSSYNDFGFIAAGDFGSYPGYLPAVVVQPVVSPIGELSFIVAVNNSHLTTVTLTINVALLAIYAPTELPSPNTVVGQQESYSNALANQPTDYSTYRRITKDNKMATGGPSFIAHGQNGIPNILFWTEDNDGNTLVNPVTWASDGHIPGVFGMKVDGTDLDIYVDSSLNGCYYRVYEDN